MSRYVEINGPAHKGGQWDVGVYEIVRGKHLTVTGSTHWSKADAEDDAERFRKYHSITSPTQYKR